MNRRPWVLPLGTAGLFLIAGCASLEGPATMTLTSCTARARRPPS